VAFSVFGVVAICEKSRSLIRKLRGFGMTITGSFEQIDGVPGGRGHPFVPQGKPEGGCYLRLELTGLAG
jgi:hypothetical protein